MYLMMHAIYTCVYVYIFIQGMVVYVSNAFASICHKDNIQLQMDTFGTYDTYIYVTDFCIYVI
jgi:hypothetical protein